MIVQFEFIQVVTFPFNEAFILLNEKINEKIKSVLDVIKKSLCDDSKALLNL